MNESCSTPLNLVPLGAGSVIDTALCPPALPTQQEFFGAKNDAAALSFVLSQVMAFPHDAGCRWLWVQDRETIRLKGRPFIHGLPRELTTGLVHVAAPCAKDALFALEEGLRCRDFAFVLGELTGNPKPLDFTASRRLSVAAERHSRPLYLLRAHAEPNLSAARRRWRISALPSSPARWNEDAPGEQRFRAELFRARDCPSGIWEGNYQEGWLKAHDKQSPSHRVDLAAASGHRPLAA